MNDYGVVTERRDVHRIPIVVALVVPLWIGMRARRFLSTAQTHG